MNNILAKAILLFLGLFFSCAKNNHSANDDYLKIIKNTYEEIKVDLNVHPATNLIYNPNRLIVLDNNNVIVVENADKSIILADDEGNELYRVGGEGRGPGEFMSIIDLHLGFNNHLYAVDGQQFQVTIYEIGNNSLNFINSVSYKNPPTYFLSSVFVSESGTFGIYSQSEGFHTPDNRYLLYLLNDQFEPEKKVFEIQGDDRQEYKTMGFTSYLPNMFSGNIFWDLDGDWFYYISSDELIVRRYNFNTQVHEEFSYFSFPERENTIQAINFIKERFIHIEDDAYWLILEEKESLAYYSEFKVHEDKIFFQILYPLSDTGKILYTNQSSKEVKYFNIPHGISRILPGNSSIYGIYQDLDQGVYSLITLDISSLL